MATNKRSRGKGSQRAPPVEAGRVGRTAATPGARGDEATPPDPARGAGPSLESRDGSAVVPVGGSRAVPAGVVSSAVPAPEAREPLSPVEPGHTGRSPDASGPNG